MTTEIWSYTVVLLLLLPLLLLVVLVLHTYITITIATLHATTVITTVVESSVIPTVITYTITATTTNIVNSPNPTAVSGDTTTVDETSEFLNTANTTSSYIAISYISEGCDFL